MLYIVWSLVIRWVTRHLTKLQTMFYNIAKYFKSIWYSSESVFLFFFNLLKFSTVPASVRYVIPVDAVGDVYGLVLFRGVWQLGSARDLKVCWRHGQVWLQCQLLQWQSNTELCLYWLFAYQDFFLQLFFFSSRFAESDVSVQKFSKCFEC